MDYGLDIFLGSEDLVSDNWVQQKEGLKLGGHFLKWG
jgi:hypothetical protein